MWQPDFSWFNADWTPLSESSGFFRIKRDGEVFMSSQITLDVECPFLMSRFPYDVQKCFAKLGVYRGNEEQVVLNFRGNQSMQVKLEAQHNEWSFVNLTGELSGDSFAAGLESRVKFNFQLHRRHECYTEMCVMSYFLLIIGYLAFHFPSGMDDTLVTFASTLVLATFFFVTWAMSYVPPHPRLSWMLQVLIWVLILNGLVLVQSIFKVYASRHADKAGTTDALPSRRLTVSEFMVTLFPRFVWRFLAIIIMLSFELEVLNAAETDELKNADQAQEYEGSAFWGFFSVPIHRLSVCIALLVINVTFTAHFVMTKKSEIKDVLRRSTARRGQPRPV